MSRDIFLDSRPCWIWMYTSSLLTDENIGAWRQNRPKKLSSLNILGFKKKLILFIS
jgi:hypothetical protein